MTLRLTFEQAPFHGPQVLKWAYNAVDCIATRHAHNALTPRLSSRAQTLYSFAFACQRPAFAMMSRGIRVDVRARAEVLKELAAEILREEARCAEMVAGVWDGVQLETGACPTPARKDGKHKWQLWEKGSSEIGRKCLACGADRMARSPFNPNSPDQVAHLLWDILGLPKERNRKGELGSTDKEVLAKLAKKYQGKIVQVAKSGSVSGELNSVTIAIDEIVGWEPDNILEGQGIRYIKQLYKRQGDIKAPLSLAGRYLFSMNIGATWTGRSSSSGSPDTTFHEGKWRKLGGNIQNKAERDRRMFVADPGFEMGYFDYQQAESWIIAYMAQDDKFIEALRAGDIHTVNCRILFPDLPWTGDLKKDKDVAERHYPEWDKAPGHNYRYQTKRISYGMPYGQTARGAAMAVKLPAAFMEEAFAKLHEAYPGIAGNFHGYVRETVGAMLPLLSPLGFEIPLLGRPWDDATFRQGCSAVPQHTVGWLTWLACLRIYNDCDPHLVQVLANVHDAGLFQWRIEHRAEAIEAIVSRMTIPIEIHGRVCTIPVEGAYGGNWGKQSASNPNGLIHCYP